MLLGHLYVYSNEKKTHKKSNKIYKRSFICINFKYVKEKKNKNNIGQINGIKFYMFYAKSGIHSAAVRTVAVAIVQVQIGYA